MQNVIKSLKDYSKKIDLRKRFVFNFDISNKIFDPSEAEQLKTAKTLFDKNVSLKKILSKKYKGNKEQDSINSIDFWIINSWGRIRGFERNEQNIKKVQRFKDQIKKKKLSLDCFSTISSLSKVSSFIDPENFVIYDSRVIYTLNWLILTCENQDKFKQKYFPMPSGRNRIITDFDMNTIVNISHIAEYKGQVELYIERQLAYFKFCNFIKSNTKSICGDSAKPYELEMLLFTLADEEIFNEMQQRINLNISYGTPK